MADRFASMEAKPKSEPSACTMGGALRHGVKRMHGLPLNHIEVNNIQTPENKNNKIKKQNTTNCTIDSGTEAYLFLKGKSPSAKLARFMI